MEDPFHIDRKKVQKQFSRAAPSYDAVAVLQREVGKRMLERLAFIKRSPLQVLDLGCGTGELTLQLAKHYKKAAMIALDLAPGMAKRAKARSGMLRKIQGVCADAHQLPLANDSVDLVFSNLALQWCQNLDAVFSEVRRVLRPGGLFMFSSFGPDTLTELRQSFRAVDDLTHVNAFIDMHDIGDALVRNRFADPVMDAERLTMTYVTLQRLLADLKSLGATNATAGRPRGLLTPRQWKKLETAYEQFRQSGHLPATWEVVYGHAWAPEVKTNSKQIGVDVVVPLSSIGRRSDRE